MKSTHKTRHSSLSVNNNNNVVMRLAQIGKKYEVHHEKPTLVEKLIQGNAQTYWALRHINLSIRKGERIGIIGPNGCGKTTLLKIMAGIAMPTEGDMQSTGKIVSLIGLDAGFHPDLSGYDNIFLNGMLLGMKQQDIRRHLSDIIRYAELGEFIDLPLHTYSMGMQLRLGFAIAIYADPDILVIDESIGVGDKKFKDKIRSTSQKMLKDKTIILVSHDMYTIVDFCDKVIVMEKGAFTFHGGVLEGIKFYQGAVSPDIRWYFNKTHAKGKKIPRISSK